MGESPAGRRGGAPGAGGRSGRWLGGARRFLRSERSGSANAGGADPAGAARLLRQQPRRGVDVG